MHRHGQGVKDATSADLQSLCLHAWAGTRADPAADQGQESQGGTTATVGSVSPKASRGEEFGWLRQVKGRNARDWAPALATTDAMAHRAPCLPITLLWPRKQLWRPTTAPINPKRVIVWIGNPPPFQVQPRYTPSTALHPPYLYFS